MSNASEITGLSGIVTALAFSPDGKTLAAADGGFDLSLWDAASGKTKGKIAGLATGTPRVAWAPGGKSVFGTTGNDLIAGDPATGKETFRIKGEMTGTAPANLALSADGAWLVGAGRGRIKIWQVGGKAIGEYEVHPNYAITSVAFSPDGQWIVTTSNDRTAQLTGAKSGTPGATFKCPSRVVAAEFSPDGKSLYVVDQAPGLHVFDVASGADSPAAGLARVPKQMAVSPDGRFVACVGPSLYIWSVSEKRWYTKPLENSGVGLTSVAFSPDGKSIACGTDNAIHLWALSEILAAR